jgi:hypothetical protein
MYAERVGVGVTLLARIWEGLSVIMGQDIGCEFGFCQFLRANVGTYLDLATAASFETLSDSHYWLLRKVTHNNSI